MSASFAQLWAFITLTLAGLSHIAQAFCNVTEVAEAASGEYKDEAQHNREVRKAEREKLLSAP
jgi:hypothetical protein